MDKQWIIAAVLGLSLAAPAAMAEVLPESQRAPKKPGAMGGGGAVLSAGSGGYRRFGVYGDALWRGPKLSPYLWSEYGADIDSRRFSLGGGAWKDLREDLRVKGGLGFSVGSFRDSDDSSSSITLETGVERDFNWPTLGTEYRYTTGSIGGSTVIRGDQKIVRGRIRGKVQSGIAATSDRFTYNEFSGYARLPAGATTVGLRATVGLASYAAAIVSETVSWTVPLNGPLAARFAFSWEQGARAAVYASAGLDCRFD
ncbi:MAG: hypothetical protein HY921_06960 [Elusimicrobia bacterium]|nr:hypothetical protein [Elusimicrobiota bacterium]